MFLCKFRAASRGSGQRFGRSEAQREHGVLAAEGEGLGDRVAGGHRLGLADEGEGKLGIGQVSRRMGDAVAQGQGRHHGLDGAAGAQGVPEQRFGGVDPRARWEELGQHPGLHGVVGRRAGAVGVDVADVLGRQAGVGQAEFEGAADLPSLRGHAHQVVGVRGLAVAHDLGQHLRSPPARAFQILQHQDGSAPLAEQEAAALAVEGAVDLRPRGGGRRRGRPRRRSRGRRSRRGRRGTRRRRRPRGRTPPGGSPGRLGPGPRCPRRRRRRRCGRVRGGRA